MAERPVEHPERAASPRPSSREDAGSRSAGAAGRRDEAALLALALVSFGMPLGIWSGGELTSQFNDDAFYYFQIAKNVAHGLGATFDGLHRTSGFHPLWMLMIAPIFGVVDDLDAAVRAVGWLEASLLGAGAIGLYRGLSPSLGRAPALLGALTLLGTPGTRRMLRTGQEAALVALLAVLLWSVWIHGRGSPLGRARKLGTVCALAALARLEWSLAVLVVVFLERASWRVRPRLLLWLALPTIVGVATFLLRNQLATGAWWPVSGAVKHFLNAAPPPSPQRRDGIGVVVLAVTLVMIGWAARRAVRAAAPRTSVESFRRLLHAQGLVVLAPCVVLTLLCDKLWLGGLEDWYLSALVPLAGVLAAVATKGVPRVAVAGALVLGALAIARVPVAWTRVRARETEGERRAAGAAWLREHLPAGTRVGAWNGGVLGYYSGQHVVMLDGLVNTPRFLRRVLVGGDWSGYLHDERIDVLALTSCRLSTLVPRAQRRAIERDFEPVATTATASDRRGGARCNGFAIWKRRMGTTQPTGPSRQRPMHRQAADG